MSILFYEAKASLDKDTANKKEAALNAKKDEERSEYNELNKYSGLNGRDKRIAILSAERADALERAKTLRAGAQAIMSASQQKEHDWAIHGGIASGIAGPAAGLAAAADIQAKNAQIRAQNEANEISDSVNEKYMELYYLLISESDMPSIIQLSSNSLWGLTPIVC